MKYDQIRYNECPDVYPPAEDTFLLMDNLKINRNDKFLEIGTGTGIVSIKASTKTGDVTAVDINPEAIRCAGQNFRLNNAENIKLFESDLFENISETYDVIVFNTPYLPVEDDEYTDNYSKAWDGGSDGRAVIDKFLEEAGDYLNRNGLIQIIQSSLSNNRKTLDYLNNNGYEAHIEDNIHMFFEDITLINAYKK